MLGDLVNLLNHGEFRAKKQATRALTNITLNGKPHQMMKLIELGVIKPLISMLDCNDIEIVQVTIFTIYSLIKLFARIKPMMIYFKNILDGITDILEMGDAQGCAEQITVRLKEAGAIDAMKILKEHENNDVSNAASTIIDSLSLIREGIMEVDHEVQKDTN